MRPREKIVEIVKRLEAEYGPRPWRRWGRPLEGLIQTVLSQHTSDVNSDAAYRGLRRAFPTWQACLGAPPARIERAIRSGGLARLKTRAILGILRALHESRGRLSLDFLGRWPTARAREYLQALPGVGPKTAACVLMFNLGRPALPVDTHVHRLSARLALIPPESSAEDAHQLLESACPPRLVYPFHVLLIEHGRKVCRARRPLCGECPLVDLCPSARVMD